MEKKIITLLFILTLAFAGCLNSVNDKKEAAKGDTTIEFAVANNGNQNSTTIAISKFTVNGKVVVNTTTASIKGYAIVVDGNKVVGQAVLVDNAFTIKNILPGTYRILISTEKFAAEPTPFVIKDKDVVLDAIILKERVPETKPTDKTTTPAIVKPEDKPPVTITKYSVSGKVTVSTTSEIIKGMIVLVQGNRVMGQAELVNNQYTIKNIVPGTYRILAVIANLVGDPKDVMVKDKDITVDAIVLRAKTPEVKPSANTTPSGVSTTGVNTNIPVVGNQIPEFQVLDMDGKSVNISSFKGKTVLLNFWATWCGPCVSEMPSIQSLYDKYKNSDFVVVAVSLDKTMDVIKRFVAEKKYTIPVFQDNTGVATKFGITAIPTTFIIDKNGVIVSKEIGFRDWSKFDTANLK